MGSVMHKLNFHAISLAAFLLGSGAALAAPTAKAPPLPAGSARVSVQLGQNPDETNRAIHAHKRPIRDKQRDDTLPTTAPPAAGTATAPATLVAATSPSGK